MEMTKVKRMTDIDIDFKERERKNWASVAEGWRRRDKNNKDTQLN
jgi:hypothetical protein